MEYLGNVTILDTIFELGSDLESNILVPLSCLVDYKGMRAVVKPNMNFKSERMVYGVKKKKMLFNDNLTKGLSQIGKKLNSQAHPHKNRTANGTLIEVPITQNIKVYKTMKYTLESLLARTDIDIK